MIILPIDYYPMPSDPNSQKQVLNEEKSRLNEERQAVNDSRLPNSRKESINNEIDGKTDNIKNLIKNQDEKKTRKEKTDKLNLQKKQENNKALEKQTADSNTKYKRFDETV